jgi:hypothetical protein
MTRPDDLRTLKEDMVAFIGGHGMKRFHGFVSDDVESVMWDSDNPEGWKDFVELAQGSSAPFVTMTDVVLEREDVDILIDRMKSGNYVDEEEVEEARWLRSYVGKTGFVQLGFPFQGIMFLFQTSTEWYDRYEDMLESTTDFGVVIDESDRDEER